MASRTDRTIPDVLADRYASREMAEIWSPAARIVIERDFWIAVLRAQRALGIDVPSQAVEAYERVKDQVDLSSIRKRERITRHDVKARIDEFCALAGYEHIHKGLTSRDVTDNVEQLQILRSLRLLRIKYAACLAYMAHRVEEHRALKLTGRTHNVPAQLTTVGKRLAMFGTEMIGAYRCLEELIARYPMRGLKGAVGTQLDLLTLLDDDVGKVEALERAIAQELGFNHVLSAIGQVYPRSLDFEVTSVLFQLAAGPSSFAKTFRLMAGHGLAAEGFQGGHVGSSAMPHKINSRSCERINGLQVVLGGYLTMISGITGDQWNEGDVSCSVVRRIALPGAMFAIDGLLETFLTVVGEMELFTGIIGMEQEQVLPFLASTTILMKAVKRGAGRETAHAAIKEHALTVARQLRSGRRDNDLLERLAGDPRVGLTLDELQQVLAVAGRHVGAALGQADAFVDQVREILRQVPEAKDYKPRQIL